MVISPAKTLDLSPLSERELEMVDHETITAISSAKDTSLCDRDKTNEIVNIMKKKSEAELKSLLSLSPALAKVSHQYWQDFSMDKNDKKRKDESLFAVFTFNGPAFQGISAHNCNESTLAYMGQNLFILDAVFGVLRSLDTLQPYRLEMGCKGIVTSNNNNAKGKKETLASYWKESVTTYLGKELIKSSSSKGKSSSPSAILANLASDEYSSSIDIASLPPNTIYINTIFRHQGRVLAVHAKRARGLMARYLCETDAQTLEDVSKFNLENYTCIDSDGGNKWEVIDVVGDNVQVIQMVFDRSEAPPKAKAAGKRTAASSSKKGTKKAKKK